MRLGRRRRARPERIVLLVAGILLWPVLAVRSSASPPAQAPASGRIASNFSRMDLNHEDITLETYRGKVVLLNFWATWCEPCLAEIPRFAGWQQKYGQRGLQILGVSMDDGEAPVREFYRKHRLNYPVVMGDEKLGEAYGGILGLPVTFLIDIDGRIRYQHDGATDLDVMEREIREMLPRP